MTVAAAVSAQTTVVSGTRPARLIIRNATIVDGNGTPAKGPFDIVVEGTRSRSSSRSTRCSGRNGAGRRPRADANTAEIDATGKYVLPGLINAHAHLQDERGGTAQPIEYEFKIWLACGITAVRDVGSDTRKALAWRDASNKGTLAAPRIFVYPQFGRPTNADSARARVRALKAMGADGIKLLGIDRDIMQVMEEEAHKEGLRIAHHVGVEETNAWDDIRFGTTSIEHWYGIPDAAILDGVQGFPSYYNYNNETDRFRWAGHLWREADPARLQMVLDSMVARHVAWVPTFDIYEASRDLQRARTQPWFGDYLHPTLEEYFKPDPANHGSYFFGWTSTDETFWKENYRIWMNAVRDFERKGGLVGAGDDAGFIYQMYGFGLAARARAAPGSRLQSDQGHPARDVQQRAHPRQGDRTRAGSTGVQGGSHRRERQPAREPESPLPHWRRRHQERQARAHRRRRVDDQGRHPLSRSDVDGRSEADGGQGAGRSRNQGRPHGQEWTNPLTSHRTGGKVGLRCHRKTRSRRPRRE